MSKVDCDNCPNHSGMEARMVRSESDIQTLFKSITAMRNWVIAGMGSLLMSGLVFVSNAVLQHFGK